MPTTKPDPETGWTTERPQVDGDYFYRWRGQRTIYSIALGKIWGALSGTEQHPPLEGAEWLGPFTPSDFEQLIRLRSQPSVSDAIKEVERLYDEWWDIDRRRWLNVVLERLRALNTQTGEREALALRPTGEQS